MPSDSRSARHRLPNSRRDWRELHNHMAASPQQDPYVSAADAATGIPEMKAATLRRALDGLSAAGRGTLDSSQLPF